MKNYDYMIRAVLLFMVLVAFLLSGCSDKNNNLIIRENVLTQESNWQLFIDDYLIADTSNIIATLHQPEKYSNNPVIKGDSLWAQNPYCFGTVIYDDEESIFKIWYQSYNYNQPLEDRTPILYATSKDGINWDIPNLGIVSYQGSKDNNIILTNYGYHDLYSPSVIKDSNERNPDRRYKMIWWDFPLGNKGYQDDGMCVAFSPDGIHWNKYQNNPVLHASKNEQSISDVMSVMFDRNKNNFVAYTKGWASPWPAFRQIVRTESKDFIHWSDPEVVITHKHDINDPQSYGMTVAQIGNNYIGMLAIYKKPGDETIDIQLAVSHDNRHWKRVANQATFIPNGPVGSWDAGMIFTAPLLNHDGKTLIYYGGFSKPHNVENGKNSASIGLATLRFNGFVSLDADKEVGIITTKPIQKFEGKLIVNADANNGSLKAELIDAAGNTIKGYSSEECIPITKDGIAQVVVWENKEELPDKFNTICIRFQLQNTSLYGFYAGAKANRYIEE